LPPAGNSPFPLVLLAHGAGGAKDAPYMDATAGPWASRGLAVASIDFPLHGERSEAKLFQLLTAELAGPDPGRLAGDFVRQAISDLDHALRAVCDLDEIDADRVGYSGFSLGSILGAKFCSAEPRIRAAAFALGGAGLGGASLESDRDLANFAPRPVLLVNTNSDETIPRDAALAWFAAAREPKQQLWFDGTHTELPGRALKSMFQFLERHLTD